MNNKIKTKINRNTFMINSESEEDNKKREIIKNILIMYLIHILNF